MFRIAHIYQTTTSQTHIQIASMISSIGRSHLLHSIRPLTKLTTYKPRLHHQSLNRLTPQHTRTMSNMPNDSSLPGENFEPRQNSKTDDWTPNPSKSLPLNPARQALVDDIIALYSCQPTIERVKRYTPDCVYDDQFVYANDRYKMAGQWYALPKLFKDSKNESYEIVKNDPLLIQFKNEQVRSPIPSHSPPTSLHLSIHQNPLLILKKSWTFKLIPKTATINALVSLSLEPSSADSDFIRVKYHKDQADDKDYSHEGGGFSFKKWQADQVAKHMDSPEVEQFKADSQAAKEHVKTYGSGEGSAPEKNF